MKRFRLCFAATVCAVLAYGCGGGSSGGAPYPTGNSMPLDGSISGLSSSGLTLANGMDTVSPGAGATTFGFRHAVALGGTFEIAIAAQPAGLVCDVSNGSGTMDSLTASAAIVTCVPSNVTESLLASFGLDATSDGIEPVAGLMQAANASLVGTTYFAETSAGASAPGGSVFEVSLSGMLSTVHPFPASGTSDGLTPSSGLVQASDGSLYGVTPFGGANGTGAVYKISPTGVESLLWSFGGSNSGDANAPAGRLLLASDGNLYGTSLEGGTNHTGTVFRITQGGVESVVYSFGAILSGDGSAPAAGLVEAAAGVFYGCASQGGAHNSGAVFEVHANGTETLLYSFGIANSGDGANPESTLVLASDGNLYGTTNSGGLYGGGIVFKVSLAGAESTVYTFGPFGSGDGMMPQGGIIQGTDGNLYGTTLNGGVNSNGTAYRLTPSGTETILHYFGAGTAVDGLSPQGGHVQAADGSYYGTTKFGGTYGTGTVFKITAP